MYFPTQLPCLLKINRERIGFAATQIIALRLWHFPIGISEMAKLVLSCDNSKECLLLPHNTFVSLFATIFVNQDLSCIQLINVNSTDAMNSVHHLLHSACQNFMDEIISIDSLRNPYKFCMFPLFLSDDSNFIHAGLCSALRAFILHTSTKFNHLNVKSLLVCIYRHTLEHLCNTLNLLWFVF